ncbi:MAG: molybdate ABC transporter substrate-binding protein [Campylobacterota bacterium]|nr:molybdate ABC transporter substrate-binding protein [Campylobacterota bacterium]
MKKKIIFTLLLLSSFLYGKVINIAVAANVSYAIPNLIKEFNTIHPNIKVKTTLGSSGKLTAQILHGAPYDMFMSANMDYPKALYNQKVAITKPIVYAQGGLAILSNNQRSFRKGIHLLESKLIKRVAIANPKTAPYGKATIEALKNSKIFSNIKDKIIYSESISQTVSYTMMAADVGIIANSSLYSPKMKRFKKGIYWKKIDTKLYTPISQGIVLLKKAKDNKSAKAFYDFVLSYKAKNILQDFGYIIK